MKDRVIFICKLINLDELGLLQQTSGSPLFYAVPTTEFIIQQGLCIGILDLPTKININIQLIFQNIQTSSSWNKNVTFFFLCFLNKGLRSQDLPKEKGNFRFLAIATDTLGSILTPECNGLEWLQID